MPTYKDTDKKTGEIRWRYRFSYNNKRYGGTAPKENNTARAAKLMEKRHSENLIARRYTGKMPLVREFSERFLLHQKARTKPLTHVQQSATMRLHVNAEIGGLKVDHVDKEIVDKLVTKWSADSKPKTINTRLGTLRRMLSLAVDWKLIREVPEIEFLEEDDISPRFLTDQEAAELVRAAQPQWRSMILVALRTGLRIGELRGLQWLDVDLVRRVIQVRRTDPGRRKMDATSPKGKRERTVPLTNDAVDVLTSIRPEVTKPTAFVWPALLKRSGEIRMRARSEKGCWHGITFAALAAGLEDVGWHTLRHTYASHLVMRGVPIRTVQAWLGHSSIVMTEKYSHLSPDYGHAAANVLDTPLAPAALNQPATKLLGEPPRE